MAASDDGRFVGVGAGATAPTCVWELPPPHSDGAPALRLRLDAHEGGVQSLAFSPTSRGAPALATLGLQDGELRIHSLIDGALLLKADVPPMLHVLGWRHDGSELSAGGADGLLSWQVDALWDGVDTRPMEMLPIRCCPPTMHNDDGLPAPPAHVTAIAYLEPPPFTLVGDAAGGVSLWGAAGDEVPLVGWSCASKVGEVDLLHAAAVGGAHELKWLVVVGGGGKAKSIYRYTLSITPDADVEWSLLSEVALDGRLTAMCWPTAAAAQGVVGTAAGNIFHVHWGTATATPLVSAVPPPLVELAAARLPAGVAPSLLATVSAAKDNEGVLIWDASGETTAPLCRVQQPRDAATCVALHESTDAVDARAPLCAIGYSSGSLQLLAMAKLSVAASSCPHDAPVGCLAFAGPTLLSSDLDGCVCLSSATGASDNLQLLAVLRPPVNVAINALDVLLDPEHGGARWLCASEHQQVQVWPLPPLVGHNGTLDAAAMGEAAAGCAPLVSLALESEPLMTLQEEVKAIGWKCLAAFCPTAPSMLACCGLTQTRRLVFYDYLKRTPLMALLLSEWPTALAASRAAPLVAVAGASGRVVLASHPAGEPTASDDGDGFDSAELALHCHTIRSVHFSGGALYSASDDEVAQWRLPSSADAAGW